ncbi:MAG: hypothetical protein HRT61_20285 [Ekhidna sp.]|nr:hypothetical protein [Ekhidna sp.]
MLEEQFKAILSTTQSIEQTTPFDSFKNIKKVTDAIEESRKAQQGLDKIEKERLKLQERLAQANDERAKSNAELRVQIQQQNKANKQAAIQTSNVTTAYEKQSARLNQLRREYKDLAAQNRDNSDAAKELLREITTLDRRLKDIDQTVGQSQRNVGNYEAAVRKLSVGLKGLSAIGVIGLLDGLKDSFSQSNDGAVTLEKGLARLSATLGLFTGSVLKAVRNSDSFLDIFSELQKSFSGFEESLESIIDLQDEAIEKTVEYSNQNQALERQLGELTKTQELYSQAAGDPTLSLEAQNKANEQFLIISEQVAALQLEIANNELEIATARRQASIEANKNGKATLEAEQAFTDAVLKRIEAEKALQSATAEASTERRQIRSDQAELELDVLIDAFDNIKTINERIIADDSTTTAERFRLLQENERQAAESYARQIALLQEFTDQTLDANSLISESNLEALNEELKQSGLSEALRTRLLEVIRERRTTLQDLGDTQNDLNEVQQESIDLQADINAQIATSNRLQAEGANLEEELTALEEMRIDNQIKNLQRRLSLEKKGSVEFLRIQQQLLDALFAKRQAAEEKQAKETQKRLERQRLEASIESQKELLRVLNDLDATQKEIDAARKEFNDEQLQNEIDALNRQIEARRQAGEDTLALEEQLNQKLIEKQDARLANEKEALEQRQELTRQAFELAGDFIESQNQKRLETLDAQIEASQARQAQLFEAAERGAQSATDNIALEQQRQAQLQAQREAEQRRANQTELVFAAIKTYSGKVQNGDPKPLPSTITDITLLEQFVRALPAFYEGTENVGASIGESTLLSGQRVDKHLVRLDGSERVVNGAQNALIGNMSNDELALLAHDYQSGAFDVSPTNVQIDMRELVSSVNEVKQAINNKPTYLGKDYNAQRKEVIDIVQRENLIQRTHRKSGGIWGK